MERDVLKKALEDTATKGKKNAQRFNLIASPDEVKRELAFIDNLLEDGNLQLARELLMPLHSEVVLETVSLPLLTYPQL